MPTIHLDIDFSVLLRCTVHALSTSWPSGEYEQGPQAPVLGRDHAPSLPLPTHRRGSDPRVGFPSAHSHYANPVQTLSAQRFPGLVTSLHDLREAWKSCGQHRHADHQHEHSSNRGYLEPAVCEWPHACGQIRPPVAELATVAYAADQLLANLEARTIAAPVDY